MMRQILLLLSLNFIFWNNLLAQAPQMLSYQGVARDNGGSELSMQTIGVLTSIRQYSPTGAVMYSESHNPTTNAFGLFKLNIGGGNYLTGSFSTIDWSAGPYFLDIELDATGGTNYQPMGVSEFLSVPYALYAETSGNAAIGPIGPTGPTGAVGNDGLDGATGPTGPLVAGTNGQTLRRGVSDWEASDMLYNTGAAIGVGTTSPSANFHLDGSLRIQDGNEGNGKVLTSDNSGNATWQQPNPSIAYRSLVGSYASDIRNMTVYSNDSVQITQTGTYLMNFSLKGGNDALHVTPYSGTDIQGYASVYVNRIVGPSTTVTQTLPIFIQQEDIGVNASYLRHLPSASSNSTMVYLQNGDWVKLSMYVQSGGSPVPSDTWYVSHYGIDMIRLGN